MRDKIIEAVRNASVEGRLSCERAHALALELGVPLRELGAICTELKVKITACQLGCF